MSVEFNGEAFESGSTNPLEEAELRFRSFVGAADLFTLADLEANQSELQTHLDQMATELLPAELVHVTIDPYAAQQYELGSEDWALPEPELLGRVVGFYTIKNAVSTHDLDTINELMDSENLDIVEAQDDPKDTYVELSLGVRLQLGFPGKDWSKDSTLVNIPMEAIKEMTELYSRNIFENESDLFDSVFEMLVVDSKAGPVELEAAMNEELATLTEESAAVGESVDLILSEGSEIYPVLLDDTDISEALQNYKPAYVLMHLSGKVVDFGWQWHEADGHQMPQLLIHLEDAETGEVVALKSNDIEYSKTKSKLDNPSDIFLHEKNVFVQNLPPEDISDRKLLDQAVNAIEENLPELSYLVGAEIACEIKKGTNIGVIIESEDEDGESTYQYATADTEYTDEVSGVVKAIWPETITYEKDGKEAVKVRLQCQLDVSGNEYLAQQGVVSMTIPVFAITKGQILFSPYNN